MDALAEQIEEYNNELLLQLPAEVLEAFGKSIVELQRENIEKSSLQIGNKITDFSLPNAFGEIIHSEEILEKGKMVIAFYRGGWCPYCNLQLRFLQANISKITNRKAVLLAVSPQTPNHSLMMVEKNNLEFEVLTDHDNTLAEKLGIVFQIQEFVLPYYKDLGITLSDYNGNEHNKLPVPAVFVIDQNHVVSFRFLDVNYMNRLNLEKLLEVL